MKKPNHHIQTFIDLVGGRKVAAKRLGVSLAMVGHLCTGERSVSPQVAKRIEEVSGGAITRAALLPDLFGPVDPKKGATYSEATP